MRKVLKRVVVVAVIVFVGYAVYKRVAMKPPGPPDMAAMMAAAGPPPVGVASVEQRDVEIWKEYAGRLSAMETVEVRPRVAGMIDEVKFQDGALVEKGAVLFVIDRSMYVAAYKEAEAMLESAMVHHNLMRKESERAERLHKDKAIPVGEYDQRTSAFKSAEAQLQQARAVLAKTMLNLEYTNVRAPIAGRVGRAEITQGNLVDAGANAPMLTTIVSSSPIYADFEIDEGAFLYFMKKASGSASVWQDTQKIPVELALAAETGETYTGHIQSIDNRLDPSSGTIRVRAVFDNEDGVLVPGLFARILLGSAEKQSVLLVPDGAVGTDQNRKYLLVVDDSNIVQYREVRMGPLVEGMRVIEEGVQAGEKIVVSGLHMARPGAPVTPQPADATPEGMPPPPQADAPAPEKEADKEAVE